MIPVICKNPQLIVSLLEICFCHLLQDTIMDPLYTQALNHPIIYLNYKCNLTRDLSVSPLSNCRSRVCV